MVNTSISTRNILPSIIATAAAAVNHKRSTDAHFSAVFIHYYEVNLGDYAAADDNAVIWHALKSLPRLTHYIKTRLPSNLRPTIRECVHLLIRGHFQSCNKDGGHTIQSTIAEKTQAMQTRTRVMATCGNRDFSTVVGQGQGWPWPWRWSDDLHIRN